jgi:hypothetical protein
MDGGEEGMGVWLWMVENMRRQVMVVKRDLLLLVKR